MATLANKRLLPERHLQASGPLAQVYRKPGRLCWKETVPVSENKSMFLFYLQIIIHICPTLVLLATLDDGGYENRKAYVLMIIKSKAMNSLCWLF